MIEEHNGGKHTKLAERYDLVAVDAERLKAQILAEGAVRYNDPDGSNWRKIPIRHHLNHALAHIYEYLDGNRDEAHLGHAYCRLMFAVALELASCKNFLDTRKPSE